MGIDGINKINDNIVQPKSNNNPVKEIKLNGKSLPDLYDESYDFSEKPEDVQALFNLLTILKDDTLISDEILLEELEHLKNGETNVSELLEIYRENNRGFGLLNEICSKTQIKNSTKEKYRKFFTKELEQEFSFDRKLNRKNISTTFETENFEYQSDSYNVKQKNENILEITNLQTKEKRTIDFRKLIPEGLNGINDIIELKASIQNLPPEILFRIPEEISGIRKTEVVKLQTKILSNGENTIEYDGSLGFTKDNKEILHSSANENTLIHEIAHAIFCNAEGHDTLYDNPEVVKEYEKSIQKLQNDGYGTWNKNGGANKMGYYWSKDLSEYGAGIITAVFAQDSDTLESLKKYSPDGFKAVLEHFKAREHATDKHNHHNILESYETKQ